MSTSPDATKRPRERAVRVVLFALGASVLVATVALIAFVARTGLRGMAEAGLGSLLFGRVWKPEAETFGGLPLLVGTFVSATGAVAVGGAPAVLTAVYASELASRPTRTLLRRVLELAAAVPSVVWGWLALTWLVPPMGSVAHALLGEDALVGGEGLATAAVLLAVMIGPTVGLLALDALERIPTAYREASMALGASDVQTAFRVSVPTSWRGLVVALFFGFARAAGETMAVQMVIGGARRLPDTLFSPTTTISTQIVMDMQNARPSTVAADVLYSMALVLLVLSVTFVVVTRHLTRARA